MGRVLLTSSWGSGSAIWHLQICGSVNPWLCQSGQWDPRLLALNSRLSALACGIWSCDFMIWALETLLICIRCVNDVEFDDDNNDGVACGFPAVAVVIKIGFALNAINKTPEHFCWQMSSLKIIHSPGCRAARGQGFSFFCLYLYFFFYFCVKRSGFWGLVPGVRWLKREKVFVETYQSIYKRYLLLLWLLLGGDLGYRNTYYRT